MAVSGRMRKVISSLLRLIIEKKISKTSPIPGNLLLFNFIFNSASVMIATSAAVMQVRHHPQAQYLTPQIATTFPLLLDSDRTWISNAIDNPSNYFFPFLHISFISAVLVIRRRIRQRRRRGYCRLLPTYCQHYYCTGGGSGGGNANANTFAAAAAEAMALPTPTP
jgi:hypothetical protein